MNRGTKVVYFLLAALIVLLTIGVTYADEGVYIDAAVGRAQVDNQIAGVFLEDDSLAVRFGLGYEFAANMAVEAGYINLGEVEADVFGGLNDARTDGLVLNARFTLPLGDTLDAGVRVGAFFWDAQVTTPIATFANEGEDIFYGLGLDFQASRNLTLTAQWDRFEFGDSDADALWAGLRFRF